jgi:hypothetical protein
VHSPVDRLCRHAARAVRSLGMPLWKRLWISTHNGFGLRERSAQAVHRRKFEPWKARRRTLSYPHWRFDVQRHVAGPPGLRNTAIRSADSRGTRLRQQLLFEYVFERGSDGPNTRAGRVGSPPHSRDRGPSNCGRNGCRCHEPGGRRTPRPGLGDDYSGRSGAGRARCPIFAVAGARGVLASQAFRPARRQRADRRSAST